MPEWLFDAYDRATSRLEAEETQLLVKALVAGTGHMKDEEFSRFQKQLARVAAADTQEDSSIGRPRTAEEMRMMVRQLGLGGFKVDIEGT